MPFRRVPRSGILEPWVTSYPPYLASRDGVEGVVVCLRYDGGLFCFDEFFSAFVSCWTTHQVGCVVQKLVGESGLARQLAGVIVRAVATDKIKIMKCATATHILWITCAVRVEQLSLGFIQGNQA